MSRRFLARGFTLLEVLVAMVILAIAFTWLIRATGQGVDMAQRARFITTATILAQERMGRMADSDARFITGAERGDFGEDYAGYSYEEKREVTPLTGYYKYSLKIFWGGEKSGFATEFVTFITGA